MPRSITDSLMNKLSKQNSSAVVLAFLTVDHPEWAQSWRFTSDAVDYMWRGVRWQKYPFDVRFVSDDENPPETQLSIPNTDQRIGQTIQRLRTPCRVKIELVDAAWFNQTVIPRVPLGSDSSPIVEATVSNMFLRNVTGTAMEIRGALQSWNYKQEPWPGIRATAEVLKGLYF